MLTSASHSGLIYVDTDASIQEAVDELHQKGGGTVVLQKGKHRITEPIRLKSNVNLIGDYNLSRDKVIITPKSDDYSQPLIEGQNIENVTLENFKIRGNMTEQEQQLPGSYHTSRTAYTTEGIRHNQFGILITGDGEDYDSAVNRNITIKDLVVRNCTMGIHVKGTRDLYMSRLKVHKNGLIQGFFHNVYLRRVFKAEVKFSKLYESLTGNGLNVSQSSDIKVRKNQAYDNYFRGIRVEGERGYVAVSYTHLTLPTIA